MAFMCLTPLSPPYIASFPQVLLSSSRPAKPNPILESHVLQSFSLLPMMPILALLDDVTELKPSRLQFVCSEACSPISLFQVLRPSEVGRYFPSAIKEYKEFAYLWMTIDLTWLPIFIARQTLENGVLQ